MRWLPALFAALAIALIACACYYYSAPRSVAPTSMVVTPQEFHGLVLPAGRHDFVVRVRNPTNRPLGILGFRTGCTSTCCTDVDKPEKVTVPAGGEVVVHCSLVVHAPGPIDTGIAFICEGDGLTEIGVMFEGQAVGDDHAPANAK